VNGVFDRFPRPKIVVGHGGNMFLVNIGGLLTDWILYGAPRVYRGKLHCSSTFKSGMC